MAKPALDRPDVVPRVAEGVTTGVPQHGGMDLELRPAAAVARLIIRARPAVVNAEALVVVQLRHCTPVRLSRGGCSFQFGRASAPTIPHPAQTIRGPKAGTAVGPGIGAEHRLVVAVPAGHMPSSRMLPGVIGSMAGRNEALQPSPISYSPSLRAFTGRALTIFEAGLAWNVIGSFVNGLTPSCDGVAGFSAT
jgi:hypothetical protein